MVVATILVISQTLIPPSNRCTMCALTLTGQAVSEKMFENSGYILIYSPRAGADNALGSKFFINIKLMFCQVGHFLQDFPIQ